MSALVELWSDVQANSGTRTAMVKDLLQGCLATFTLDQRHELTVTVPRDAAWLTSAAPRKVLKTTLDNGDVYEWRIATVVDGRGHDGGAATIVTAFPIHLDLADVGPMKSTTSGASTFFNLGGVGATPEEFIDTFVTSASLFAWIAKGTINSTTRRDVSWDRWSRLQLLFELGARTGLEFQLRRNGTTQYLIDLVTAIGSAASTLLVSEGRNLLAVTRTRSREDLATVVIPVGTQPNGGSERAGIAFAEWQIGAFVSGTTWTLIDRAGGDGPSKFNDQLNNLYLLKTDASLVEITDSEYVSATTTRVTLTSNTGIAAGNLVELRADSSGTLITELSSPTGLASYGRITATHEVPEARGERNYIANPLLATWPLAPAEIPHSGYGEANGSTGGGTTLALKNVVIGGVAEFAVGDVVYPLQVGGTPSRITAAATVSGGNVTLTVDASPAMTDGQVVALYKVAGTSAPPDGWSSPLTATVPAVYQYHPTSGAGLSGLVNGVGQTNVYKVICDGFTASSAVYAGDTFGVGGSSYMVIAESSADGSGNITIYLNASVTVSDNAAVTITRPTFAAPQKYGKAAALLRRSNGASATTSVLQTPAYTVRYISDVATLWATAGMTLRSIAGHTLTAAGNPKPPKIQMWDTVGAAELATVRYDDVTLAALGEVDFALRTSYTMTANKTVAIRVHGVESNANNNTGDPVTYVRWVMLHLGPDSSPPVKWGSHATDLWQIGNLKLEDAHTWPTQYEVSARQLRERWTLTPPEPYLQLGQNVRLVVPEMSLDTTVRVVQVIEDLCEPENTRFILSTRLVSWAQRMVARKPDPLFGDLRSGTDTKTLVINTSPPLVPGARRFVSDQTAAAGAGALSSFTLS